MELCVFQLRRSVSFDLCVHVYSRFAAKGFGASTPFLGAAKRVGGASETFVGASYYFSYFFVCA